MWKVLASNSHWMMQGAGEKICGCCHPGTPSKGVEMGQLQPVRRERRESVSPDPLLELIDF